MRICVIIPVHNESRAIGPLVARVREKGLDVVVVDDGSTDSSATIAGNQGAEVITNQHKQGKGLSLKKGFEYALQHDYDGVITMDGDGQHDPLDIDLFLQKIHQQPRAVITGSRMENSTGMPPIRYMTNIGMSRLISLLCRQAIPDTQCGFRYISSVILRDVDLVSNDFEIETEVLIKASRYGYPVLSLPIKTIYRNEQSKISPLKDTFRFIVYIVKELFSSAKRPPEPHSRV